MSAFAEKDPEEIIWGVKAIAREVNLPERKCRWQIEQGNLAGVKKVGKQYTGVRRAIRANFEAEAV